jgi:hypothetical protein
MTTIRYTVNPACQTTPVGPWWAICLWHWFCCTLACQRCLEGGTDQIPQPNLPTEARKVGSLRGLLAAMLAAIAGCAAAPAPTPADLAYPVLVLFEQGGGVRHDDAEDLSKMRVQRIMAAGDAVFLVDSRLDIYRLDKLESVHSGIWLMAHPSDFTEVRFDLQRVASADARMARKLISECEYRLRSNEDPSLHVALEKAETLQAMLKVIDR